MNSPLFTFSLHPVNSFQEKGSATLLASSHSARLLLPHSELVLPTVPSPLLPSFPIFSLPGDIYPSIALQGPQYGPEGGRQDGKHCPQLACEETKKSTGFLCCSHMTSPKLGPVGHHQATYLPRRSVLYNNLDAEMLTKTSRSKHEEHNLLNLPRGVLLPLIFL